MPKELGECPICQRPMIYGSSVDKHHFVPKSKGGKATEYVHRVCHTKIHSLYTEKELATTYNNAEALREQNEMKAFIKWIQSKPSEYYTKSKTSHRKRERKKKY